MPDEQPTIDDEQGRTWLRDRYDNGALPPGAASFVVGKPRNDRPWERRSSKHLANDHHLASKRR